MTELDLSTREGRWKHFGSVDPIEGTKPVVKEEMTDLQSTNKNFLFDIEEVGIKNLVYPVRIDDYQTAGTFSFSTSLNQDEKGINMSRILESVEQHYDNGIQLNFTSLNEVLRTLQTSMKQSSAGVDVSGKWFFNRLSPVTNIKAIGNADVTFGLAIEGDAITRKELTINAAVTTLCPCSKEISEYSAHNQRGYVTVKAYLDKDTTLNDNYKEIILDAMEANASSILYPILKRPDEKSVTERAYENPRFVEDLIRLIAADLVGFEWIEGFDIECRNEESIHQHDAFAKIKYRK
ncbi:GTP cyclohydrolase FolE2 [Staphylococcus kloosii]|jgi:GTP cyclohydrolase I|uniref:GTP cyclohydrolase FolE2 n=1 Tax=Staphylococcus kloosii TaxID=29384 RepID=A0ABQ0XPM3_9STAP|nr:GTP cyclohydrolase FolE2 [Staphylococcus kloosii]AVQ36971.1 GTP cyclohydrolase I FolE2 [Staphylococcus kloosii]MBF7022881.1 GTP cyclohydrolase I FolE2 [Staphylococcus kloosii]PNZ07082.1 GTP cyclohydrolase I FolE2 [Staphylococcus kloosii]PTJ80577.1 GTP cyclohydrolase I FolE2 [Staphylococcus kloosii]SUM50074.1 GTP cyclohydrolase I [Staphylococcus kloosii]